MSGHTQVIPGMYHTVPVAAQSAAYRLFFYPRPCLVQQLFTVDPERLASVGAITTGDPVKDQENWHAWVSMSANAEAMCDLLDRGASIMFPNTEVPYKLYLDLNTHLHDWLTYVEQHPALDEAPLDDLQRLDELASAVYPYASALIVGRESQSRQETFLANARRNGRLMLGSRNRLRPIRPIAHAAVADRIAETILNRRSSRGL